MAELLKDKCEFFINGQRQLLIEDIRYNHTQSEEILNVLDDQYPRSRPFKDEGEGEITFILADNDDGYGPIELVLFCLGFNDWDYVSNKGKLTDLALTIDPTTGSMKRQVVDRQNDSSGTPLLFSAASPLDFTYTQRGEEIDRIGLNFTVLPTGEEIIIKVNPGGSGDTGYIHWADLATGEKEYTIYDDPVAGNEISLTTSDGSTLRLTVGAAETATVATDVAGTTPWYMVRMFNANHLDIIVWQYYDNDTNYQIFTFDRVWINSGSIQLEHKKAARGSVKFVYEEFSVTQA